MGEKVFPFIIIEDKKYPTIIMGEDNFTGWWEKGKFNSEDERAQSYKGALLEAYKQGVRGFSMSPQGTLIKVLAEFKEKKRDIVCIANPHWKSHYYIENESLWDAKYKKKLEANSFSPNESRLIRLDIKEYLMKLEIFRQFCDFCLVGNIGDNSLAYLGRDDILRLEAELCRKAGLVPIAICEAGANAAEKISLSKIDIGEYWIRFDKEQDVSKLKNLKKPLTAYKIFSGRGRFNIAGAIKKINNIPQVNSISIGVDNKKQAKETFSIIRELEGN